jgi:hypothetical protein
LLRVPSSNFEKKVLVERERTLEAVKELNVFLIKRVGIEPLLRHAKTAACPATPIQRERSILSSSTMDPQAG